MNCTVDDVAPRYQKNIKRFLLNQENIEASLRALFGKWREKRNDRGVPFLHSDFEQALETQISKLHLLSEVGVGPLYEKVRVNSFGLQVYSCSRGTNRVEAWHSAVPDFVHASTRSGFANALFHRGAVRYNRRRRRERDDRADIFMISR